MMTMMKRMMIVLLLLLTLLLLLLSMLLLLLLSHQFRLWLTTRLLPHQRARRNLARGEDGHL